VILAFGGFDPSGGAGVLMDAAAIRAAGGYAAAVPSCLAVQTPSEFRGVVPLPRAALLRALAAAADSHPLKAVKIGMVGTRAAAEAISRFLAARPELPVVLDPALRASAGGRLLARDALAAWRSLLRRARLLTPNLPEIEVLLARRIGRFEEAVEAAGELAAASGAAVLLKGGHFPWRGRRGTDVLVEAGRVTLFAPGTGRPFRDAHGTGCALAAAAAARLAAGDPLPEAVRRAKGIVERLAAGGFPSSGGRWTLFGPLPPGRKTRGRTDATRSRAPGPRIGCTAPGR